MKIDWHSLLQVALQTTVIYLYLVVALRILGRRQLGQLTVIDLLVVILLGSAVETALIHGDTSLKAGLLSASVLMVLNKALSKLFLRSKKWRHLVGCGPTLLVHDGEFVCEHLKQIGFTEEDVMAGLRQRGYSDLKGVRFAVLETDGTINVIPTDAKVHRKPKSKGPSKPAAESPST